MKRHSSIYTQVLTLGLTLLGLTSHKVTFAESNKPLAMIYDPTTKKYFVGKNTRFTIKQGTESSLIDRIEVSVNGAEYQPYDGAIQFKQEGKHSLKFRAISPVNNWAPVQFTEVFVDLTAPSSKALFAESRYFKEDKTLYAAVNSTLRLQAQDNLSGVETIEYSFDGNNFSAYTAPILVEKSGAQVIFVRAVDRVGNVEEVNKIEFVADGTAPQSVMNINGQAKPSTIEGKNYLVTNDSVNFEIKATDPEVQIQSEKDPEVSVRGSSAVKNIWVKIDNQEPTPYQRPIFFLREGPHTLSYYAEDNVGNKEREKSMTIYTVSTPPRTVATTQGTIVNTGGVNFATRDFALKLEAKDNVVGLDRIEFRVDNEQDYRTYYEPIRFLESGLHKISYHAIDRAGNVEPSRTFSVFVQTTPPETTIETAQPLVNRDGLIYSPSPNILTFNVINKGVGVEKTLYSVNDGPMQNYDGPITITAKERLYKLTYKSIDKLGNEEKNRTVTYHMVGTSPVVDLFASDGQSSEEKVRTDFFERARAESSEEAPAAAPAQATPPPAALVEAPVAAPVQKRAPASVKPAAKKAPAKAKSRKK